MESQARSSSSLVSLSFPWGLCPPSQPAAASKSKLGGSWGQLLLRSAAEHIWGCSLVGPESSLIAVGAMAETAGAWGVGSWLVSLGRGWGGAGGR